MIPIFQHKMYLNFLLLQRERFQMEFACQNVLCTFSFETASAPNWCGDVPRCGTGLNPHFLFVLPKRKRPFMVKRKGADPNLHMGASLGKRIL